VEECQSGSPYCEHRIEADTSLIGAGNPRFGSPSRITFVITSEMRDLSHVYIAWEIFPSEFNLSCIEFNCKFVWFLTR
jgi:hypothetical protein